jgi:predicted transcriptional regulator
VAADPVGRVALMSLHPEFASAILTGRKTVEFRKRRVAPDVTHVLIYATHPVGAVVGIFEIAGQTTAAPTELWHQFRDVGGLTCGRFFDYFAGCTAGTGIRVGSVRSFDRSMPLRETVGLGRPPQSVQYLDDVQASRALALCDVFV